jgi:hypothetical protein
MRQFAISTKITFSPDRRRMRARLEAVVPMDAQNAPTGPKTEGQNRPVNQLYTRNSGQSRWDEFK